MDRPVPKTIKIFVCEMMKVLGVIIFKIFFTKIKTQHSVNYVVHEERVHHSLRSRREWVPARTSVPNASAKSRAGREKNGEESSGISLAPSPLAKIPSGNAFS